MDDLVVLQIRARQILGLVFPEDIALVVIGASFAGGVQRALPHLCLFCAKPVLRVPLRRVGIVELADILLVLLDEAGVVLRGFRIFLLDERAPDLLKVALAILLLQLLVESQRVLRINPLQQVDVVGGNEGIGAVHLLCQRRARM